MPQKKVLSTNKGLTVKLNLWSLETYLDEFDALKARLWLRGDATNEQTGVTVKFNGPGDLLTTLSDWNADQFKKLKKAKNTDA